MNKLLKQINDTDIRLIADKIANNIRITPEDGLLLFKKADLAMLGLLAGIVRRKKNDNFAYFNHNFHIEPTNKCIFNCRFCSYHKPEGDPESWEYSHDEMFDIVKTFDNKDVTEVHIVGGVHPSYDLHYWGTLIKKIKEYRPALHIKAFSAIELDYMITKGGCTIEEGLKLLKEYGL
ncbi:MAG: radical SAM protein, partial [Bacteroidales bacterium]|nr:radical SAM protein [Bacteroidales bacterium]